VTDEQALNVSPTWAPDGSLLYVSSRDGGRDVYQVALKPSGEAAGPSARLTTGLSAYGISISADGTRLAYAAFTETSNVWSVAIPSTGAVSVSHAAPVTTGNQTIEGFDISPDGQWLAFDSNRGGTQQIYRVRLTGGEPEQLTRDSADAFYPAWSPDGREIAFHSFRGGHRQVFVLSAEGGTPVQVTMGADDERAPSWAPDGRRLLTLANWATHPQLHIITRNTDGRWSAPETLPVVVKSDTVAAGVSVWSSDGRSIACRCANDGLVIVPVAGGPARSIVPASPSPPVGVFPHWSPEGPLVYYLAEESPNASVKVIPASGGTPRVLVRFDDPTRPWHRFGFGVRLGRAYFTLGDLQSDIWVAEVARRK
jgi:dipeptidyl aminopeptidase/acylaminoacyl peptidase